MDFRVHMVLGLIGVCLAVALVAVFRKSMNSRRRICAVDDSIVSRTEPDTDSVIHIRSEVIPEELQSLIPLAERWGIPDDAVRLGKIRSASHKEREELLLAVRAKRTALNKWLAGTDVTKCPGHVALAFMETAATETEAMQKVPAQKANREEVSVE